MNWDQIETKWAAMTRRVRPDLPMNPKSPRAAAVIDQLPPPLAALTAVVVHSDE